MMHTYLVPMKIVCHYLLDNLGFDHQKTLF